MPITAESAPSPRASKRLTIFDLIGQACAIGPLIGVGLFVAFVAQIAGGRGPLAILLAAVGMVCFAMVIAFYASLRGAGAVGDYVERAWGRRAGMAILIIYTFSLLVSGAGGFSIAVGVLVANFSKAYLFGLVPWWGGALIVVLIAWIMNVRGAEVATRAQLVIVLVSVIPFILTAIAAIIHAGPANTWDFFSIFNVTGGGNLFGGLLFAILLFGGFETVAVLAEEASNPRRTIPSRSSPLSSSPVFSSSSAPMRARFILAPSSSARPGPRNSMASPRWPTSSSQLGRHVDTRRHLCRFHQLLHRLLSGRLARALCPQPRRHPAAFSLPHEPPRRAHHGVALRPGHRAGGHCHRVFHSCPRAVQVALRCCDRAGSAPALTYAVLAIGACKILLTTKKSTPLHWLVVLVASAMPILALYGSLFPFPEGPEQWGAWGAFVAIALALIGSLAWRPGASRS